ncbi:MAG: hypothetical protein ACK5NG_06950 [Chthoniobacterales bacterium]
MLIKTTINLPDDLLQRAKIVAAQRWTTLRELVVRGLNHALEHGADADRKANLKRLLEEMRADNTEPMTPFPASKPISAEVFLDTNILLYACSADLIRRMHICEEKSSGIDRLVQASEAYQLPRPLFVSA